MGVGVGGAQERWRRGCSAKVDRRGVVAACRRPLRLWWGGCPAWPRPLTPAGAPLLYALTPPRERRLDGQPSSGGCSSSSNAPPSLLQALDRAGPALRRRQLPRRSLAQRPPRRTPATTRAGGWRMRRLHPRPLWSLAVVARGGGPATTACFGGGRARTICASAPDDPWTTPPATLLAPPALSLASLPRALRSVGLPTLPSSWCRAVG